MTSFRHNTKIGVSIIDSIPHCHSKYALKRGKNQEMWLRYYIEEKLEYSTVQGFFHQPAHPRGEGATIKRISPPRKPPAGGIAADPRRFRCGFYR